MAQTKVQLLQPDLGDVIDFDSSTLFMDGSDNRVGIRNTNPQYELDVTGTVNATNFRGNISVGTIDDWITHTGDTNTKFGFSGNDTFQVHTSGTPSLQLDSGGRVLIGNAGTYSASGDLHVVGDTNSNGPELYLQVNNNNTTDNIGAIWYGNNVDKSLVKLAGHSHTANNTADFTVSTSSGGTVGERLRIDSSGHMGLGITPSDIDSIGRSLNIASSTGGAIYLQDTDSPTGKFAAISYNGGTAALQIHAHHSASYIDLGTNGTERLRINSSGQIITGGGTAISFNNQGNNYFGSWFEINGSHTVNHCGVLGITGNTATNNTKVGRIQFLNIDNTHNSSAGQNTSRSLASMDVYADVANNNSADDSGGRLVISTKAKAGTNNELLFLTAEKTVGINVIPTAGDLATGTTIGTPTFMVDCDHQGNGAYHIARFRAGSDNDNNAAVVTINHSNDRGLAIYGGRSTGNRSWGAIKSIDNVGRVTNAIEIIGDEGQGVQDIKFYTGDATTTTQRLHITSDGDVGIGVSPSSGIKLHIKDTTSDGAIKLEGTGSTLGTWIALQNNDATANSYSLIQGADAGGQGTSEIKFINVNNSNNEGALTIGTRPSGGSMAERLRITSTGLIGINQGSSYAPLTSLDVRHINGTAGTGTVQYLFTLCGGRNSARGLEIGTGYPTSGNQNDAAVYYNAKDTENGNYHAQHNWQNGGVTAMTLGYTGYEKRLGVGTLTPGGRNGSIDISCDDTTTWSPTSDQRGEASLTLRNPSANTNTFTAMHFFNGGGTGSDVTLAAVRKGNMEADFHVMRRINNAGQGQDNRASVTMRGLNTGPRVIIWAEGTGDNNGDQQCGNHIFESQQMPGFNQYVYWNFKIGSGSYSRAGSLRYHCTWSTGHASGSGYQIGTILWINNHSGGGTCDVREHLIYRNRYHNGHHYGWTSAPYLEVFQNTNTGSNAGIIFRCQGHGSHNSASYNMTTVCHLHIEHMSVAQNSITPRLERFGTSSVSGTGSAISGDRLGYSTFQDSQPVSNSTDF